MIAIMGEIVTEVLRKSDGYILAKLESGMRRLSLVDQGNITKESGEQLEIK